VDKLRDTCQGKTLEQVWASKEVKELASNLRQDCQDIITHLASQDHKRHIPVYISLKPKLKVLGRYFQKSRGNGSIVIYPIRATSFPVTSFHILDASQILETLKHEYAHHLARDASPHGKLFNEALAGIAKR